MGFADLAGSSKKFIAIIPAAGSGSRMGFTHSKLLCEIDGQSILSRTFSAFSKLNLFLQIIVPCRDCDREEFAKQASDIGPNFEFISGGASRQASVKAGLEHIILTNEHSENIIVLVHDAARCFVSSELLQRCLEATISNRAVSAGVECVDTVYAQDEQGFLTLPLLKRASLRAIQTPQAFDFELLWHAHSQSTMESSDDAGLVAQFHPVLVIPGEVANCKVTTQLDLQTKSN